MSSNNEQNKLFIAKAKKLFNQKGYEVKTSHLYDIFSQLSGYKNWHIASKKDPILAQSIKLEVDKNKDNPEFLNIFENDNESINRILEMKTKGILDDKFFLGYKENNTPYLVDFFKSPNGLFIGKMGSGKTESLKSTLFAWMIANSHKTQLFIIDSTQRAVDFSIFFKSNQVCKAVGSKEKAIQSIDLIYEEFEKRKEMFLSVVGTEQLLLDYEKKTGLTFNRILTIFEDFQNLAKDLDFEKLMYQNSTTANKLLTMLRTGRTLGIWFMMSSNRFTRADIPTGAFGSFTHKIGFKMSQGESVYIFGDTRASFIEEKGKALTEEGFINTPYLGSSNEQLEIVLAENIKPLIGAFAFLNTKMINDLNHPLKISHKDSQDYKEIHFLINCMKFGDTYDIPKTDSSKEIFIVKSEECLKEVIQCSLDELDYRKRFPDFNHKSFSKIFINFGYFFENKFLEEQDVIKLLTEGRSYGIIILITSNSSQSTEDNFPKNLKEGLKTDKFRVVDTGNNNEFSVLSPKMNRFWNF
jgi:hypothetical protein